MTPFKICGITDPRDAILAARAGATAIGCIFTPKSPRYVDIDTAKAIVQACPLFMTVVGVFLNQSVEEIQSVSAAVPLQMIQLHGEESPDMCAQLPQPVIKAFSINSTDDQQQMTPYLSVISAVLLDQQHQGQRGGTGKHCNWAVAATIVKTISVPVILSGGLGPNSVQKAIQTVQPAAIDLSSGVEKSPGKKDPEKLTAFSQRLRQ